MNLVIGISFGLGSSLIGIGIYLRQLRQVKFYQAVIVFCQDLVTQISFVLKPLPQILVTQHLHQGTEFAKVIMRYRNLLQQGADITRENCQQITDDADLAEFFFQLGRTGSSQEQIKIKNTLQIFQTKKQQAELNLRGKASITMKLLIIIGIAGVILWM